MSNLAHWDERYRTGSMPWDSGHVSSELVRVVREERVQPCRTIDLGCGTGSNAIWLAAQGFDVTAVDLSPLAIRRAEERAAAEGVRGHFLAADLLDPPDLGAPFDFLFDRGCYHVVRRTDVQAYVRTLERITRPGTLGLVLAGNAREPHEPGPPVVTEEEIRADLGALFEVVWLREFYFDQVPGDARHLGWSCLLRRQVRSGA